jgi:hypothetical protein
MSRRDKIFSSEKTVNGEGVADRESFIDISLVISFANVVPKGL